MDQKLNQWLNDHKIEYELFQHPAVYTVNEASKYYDKIPGLHCKNLFLKDSKKKWFYLVSMPHEKVIPLNELRKRIGAKKLTFASKDELKEILDLEPGSVTPFGLINVPDHIKISFIIDRDIIEADAVCFHPNTNTATLTIPRESFQNVLHGFSKIDQKIID